MLIKDLIEITDFELLTGNPEREVSGCYIGDLLSLAMSKVHKNNVWITIQSNINIIAVASLTEAGCIVINEGFEPDDGVLQRAQTEGITVLKSSLSAYEIAKIFAGVGI